MQRGREVAQIEPRPRLGREASMMIGARTMADTGETPLTPGGDICQRAWLKCCKEPRAAHNALTFARALTHAARQGWARNTTGLLELLELETVNAAQIYVRLQLALKQGAVEFDEGPLRHQLDELLPLLPTTWAEILAAAASGDNPFNDDGADAK